MGALLFCELPVTCPPRLSRGTLCDRDVQKERALSPDKITIAQLESFLFKSADILRGKMDASEFRAPDVPREFLGFCAFLRTWVRTIMCPLFPWGSGSC